jgi:hypothetical protein
VLGQGYWQRLHRFKEGVEDNIAPAAQVRVVMFARTVTDSLLDSAAATEAKLNAALAPDPAANTGACSCALP